MSKITIQQRIEKHSIQNEKNGCVEWVAFKNHCGYGRINVGGQIRFAHRVAYELKHGKIPDGIEICHFCDNPACVNVDHLFPATHAENMADMRQKGRADRLKKSKGVLHHMAKLHDADVKKILLDDRSPSAICAEYGVTEGAIRQIKVRKTWRHVEI